VSFARSAADRRVYRPSARGEAASGQRQVVALDLASLNLGLQGGVSSVGAGDNEQAAGALVEPVNDAGALRVLPTAEDLAQLVNKGWAMVGGRRVDYEAGRLVDDGERLVEVDDAQFRGHLSIGSRR
jgi:hypothetical protein